MVAWASAMGSVTTVKWVRLAMPKEGGDGYIRGVAACGHEDAADAWLIVAGVERPPAVVEVNFEPGAEVHGRCGGRHTDIAQISCGVTRGNIQRAAESHREMLEIAANSKALGVDIQGGFGGAGVLIPEGYLCVYPIADRLHARPAGRHFAK